MSAKKCPMLDFHGSRPSFYKGALYVGHEADQLPPSSRLNINEVLRPSYENSDIASRSNPRFDELIEADIKQNGARVQLSDATLSKMFKIQVPDKTDIVWQAEYNRRLAMGETPDMLARSLPLGRAQRVTTTTSNFAQVGLDLDSKIALLQSAVTQGRTESATERGAILARVMDILTATGDLTAINDTQFEAMARLLRTIMIPSDHIQAGLPRRLYDIRTFSANQSEILPFLLSNIPLNRSAMQPLMTNDVRGNAIPMRITSMISALGRNQARRYLDIENRTVISRDDLDILLLAGVDSALPPLKLP
jgi:hypothetical protein